MAGNASDVDPCGPSWTQVDLGRPKWAQVDPCGPMWTHVPCGPSWTKVPSSGTQSKNWIFGTSNIATQK